MISALIVAGCVQFPDLDHTQTDALADAAYPALVPIDPILTSVAGPRADPLLQEAQLNTRLSALRARADRLRGTVLTGQEKQRLQQGLR